MTVYATQAISSDKVKLRWEEPYVSAAMNVVASVLPDGVYRGFEPHEAAVPDDTVVLDLPNYGSGGAGPSVAIVRSGALAGLGSKPTFSVAVTEDAPVVVPMGTALPNNSGSTRTVFVVLVPTYAPSSATTAEYRVVDLAELMALIPSVGLIFLCRIDIPNLATTVLTSYLAVDDGLDAGLPGGFTKQRPWLSSTGAVSSDSPEFGFMHPGWMHEIYEMRNRGLQEVYDIERGNLSGADGAIPGDGGFTNPTPGKGRRIDKGGRGAVQILAGHVGFVPGDTFSDRVQQGCLQILLTPVAGVGSGQDHGMSRLTGDEWGVVVDQTRDANDRQRFAFLARNLFEAAETGRAAITNLAGLNAVLLSGAGEVSADTVTQPALKFGAPTGGPGGSKVSDIAPGDILELVTTNNGLLTGLFVVSEVLDDGPTNSKLKIYHVGTGVEPDFAGSSVTSGMARIFRTDFWAGKGGDPTSYVGETVDRWSLNVRTPPGARAGGIRITVAEDAKAFEVLGPTGSAIDYWASQIAYDASNGWVQSKGPHRLGERSVAFYETAVGHAAGGYRYGTVTGDHNARWLRIHQSQCVVVATSGSPTISRFTTSRMLQVSASGNATVVAFVGFQLPRGAVLRRAWASVRTPGTVGTDTLELSFSTGGGAPTAIATANVSHTNDVQSIVTSGSGSKTASQLSADPSAAWEDFFVMYTWNYDATLGGTQNFFLKGFVVKYDMPTGSELREGT